ncbi:hypothetical protein [Streptosporangium oxazolinicum]|uniref:hypothetical protein n=1 Tax=Streptosporangium oxazolinicum TaxID=909287 RepID=UPI0031EB0720
MPTLAARSASNVVARSVLKLVLRPAARSVLGFAVSVLKFAVRSVLKAESSPKL